MILIAPDKFKGTLSAQEATNIIAKALGTSDVMRAPMADGGEGTADVLCSGMAWDRHDVYYVDRNRRLAVIDSSAVIGLKGIDISHYDILKASSAPLGIKVREILKGGCEKVIIGIGGTATCDGGMGFIEGLGIEKIKEYRHRILGLSDVRVPLVAPIGEPSALMFAPQKGASDLDLQVLRRRLDALYHKYPHCRSPYDGAGGGLGFAIASVIGAECHDGARYVINHYDIEWDKIELIITGEGCIDDQTAKGKVVGTLSEIARERGIPIVAFGGRVADGLKRVNVISTSDYYTDMPLNSTTAALRLDAAVRDYFK